MAGGDVTSEGGGDTTRQTYDKGTCSISQRGSVPPNEEEISATPQGLLG